MEIQHAPIFMDEDDFFEDPFEMIQEMEAQRRRPSGAFGMHTPDDHAEKTANDETVDNTIESHSSLYIFAIIVILIAALGFYVH